jgi:hypothetical protein
MKVFDLYNDKNHQLTIEKKIELEALHDANHDANHDDRDRIKALLLHSKG